MNLSRYFTLAELSHSNTAVAERIPNVPGDAERAQLAALCTQVLDPLREALGHPIRVTSGYRGPALNARIRGSTTSQHMRGQAADLQSAAVSVLELFKMVIRMGLPFDQLIFEAKNATTKWVHVSHNPAGNRGKICVAQFDANGRAVGFPQISADQALAMVDRVTRSARPGQWPGYVEAGDEPEHEDAPMPAPAPVSTPATVPAPQPAAKSAAPRKAAAKKAPATKPAAKKPAAKKVAAKKVAAKKVVAKKVAAKAVVARKAAAKTPAAKKAAVKGSALKPSVAKNPAAKKATPARAAPKKATLTKPAAKKLVAKKVAGKQVATKPALAKKAPAKKAPAKTTPARKTRA